MSAFFKRISLDYSNATKGDLAISGEFSGSSMPPNSSPSQRGGWGDDANREKQRPPTYNPEDYAVALRKWGKRPLGALPGQGMVGGQGAGYPQGVGTTPALAQPQHQELPPQHSDKDYRNPCLSPGGEMSLRQFGSLSELLTKLRADLRLAFPSFVQEFISEPLDGVSLVVEALRSIQLSQASSPHPAPGQPSHPAPRLPPAHHRRTLLDELACLQCLQSCCQRYPESARRLVSCPTGLYALAACIMSTVNKSRIIALQLLTVACEVSPQGHSGVSEALSTLRLRYGEPCRFRFLAGMLHSGLAGGELPAAGLRLLAALLRGASSPQRRLYLQAELEQAGLDVQAIRKAVARNSPSAEQVLSELARYERQLIDVDGLSEKATEAEKEKDDMKTKLQLLEKRVQILQEEKGILLSLEQCLKERCCELQEEVTSLRSEHGNSTGRNKMKSKTVQRDESSPPEDEGISSSERSLSPDDPQREPMVYEVFNVQNETILMRQGKGKEQTKIQTPVSDHSTKKMSDDEDETTIEEVIEELRNIINDAESEQYAKEKLLEQEKLSQENKKSDISVTIKSSSDTNHHNELEKRDSITSTKHNIIITNTNDYISNVENTHVDSENDIIPIKLLPQPPRKSKSLVHLFIPSAEQGVICNNNKLESPYDDDQQSYSSDEGSDSLLSASRCHPQLLPKPDRNVYVKTNNRSLLNTIMDARERAVMAEKREQLRRARARSGEDFCKKQTVKKTESFQTTEQKVGVVNVNDFQVSRDSFDGLFYLTENDHSPYGTYKKNKDKEKSHHAAMTKQREELTALIEAKKMTKSLDRIDEGLDSMVDIILTSENSRTYDWNGKVAQIKSNFDLGRDPSQIMTSKSPSKRRVTSRNSRPRQQEPKTETKIYDDYEISHNSPDGSHRLYFPGSRVSGTSFEQVSPTSNGNSTSFIIKRGHTNAGLYSGQNCNRDKNGGSRISSTPIGGKDLNRALSPSGPRSLSNNVTGSAKVTDMPSGLY